MSAWHTTAWLLFVAMFLAPRPFAAQSVGGGSSSSGSHELPDAPAPQVDMAAPSPAESVVRDSVRSEGPPPPPTPTVKSAVELGVKAQPPCRGKVPCSLTAK